MGWGLRCSPWPLSPSVSESESKNEYKMELLSWEAVPGKFAGGHEQDQGEDDADDVDFEDAAAQVAADPASKGDNGHPPGEVFGKAGQTGGLGQEGGDGIAED